MTRLPPETRVPDMTEAPPTPGPKKKTANVLWALLVVVFMVLFYAALVGPKLASFQRHKNRRDGGPPPAAVAVPLDAGGVTP